MTAEDVLQALVVYADTAKQAFYPRFFKTGKGEYGEGDRFLGITVPEVRKVARAAKEASIEVIEELLSSEWHECRLCALILLNERFKKASEEDQTMIFHFYLSHTDGVNNWDLVDVSAPNIVGAYLLGRPRDVLYRLAESEVLWERRIAIVATLTFIRKGDLGDTIRLAEKLVYQQHDLMQKAVGWMLREAGKRDKGVLVEFLERFAHIMPRTMLRYAIEKFPENERRYFMKKKELSSR